MCTHKLDDGLQSSYREDISTDTALLEVHHDIAEALDKKCLLALVLLDLSAAVDVIDPRILQICLNYFYGMTGSVLSWILSYLSVRLQKVAIVKDSLEEGASILEYHKDPSCYISARQNGVTHG